MMQCPGCGKETKYDDTWSSFFCMSCGQKLQRPAVQTNNSVQTTPRPAPVTQPAPRAFANPVAFQPAAQGDLIVSYASEHPRVNMVVIFLITKFKDRFTNGDTRAYNLGPGMHVINFQIGKRVYRREITIYPGNKPVMVQASWRRGVARISIINPQPGNPMMGY